MRQSDLRLRGRRKTRPESGSFESLPKFVKNNVAFVPQSSDNFECIFVDYKGYCNKVNVSMLYQNEILYSLVGLHSIFFWI